MAEVQALAGKRTVSYFRLLKNATKEKARAVPLEGDSSIPFKRNSKSTTTRSENISTSAGLTTKIDQTFYEGINKVSDEFYDAILNDGVIKYWLANLDRVNNKGQFWVTYAKAKVTEDKPSFKADSTAERSPKTEAVGTPRREYLALSDCGQDMPAYVSRGTGQITSTAKEDGTDGDGSAYENNANPGNGTISTKKNSSSESHTTQGGHD